MRRTSLTLLAAVGVCGAVLAIRDDAEAQRLDPRRPATFVVGAPAGAAPMARVDAARSGRTKTPLPAGTLRIDWQKATNLVLEHPALVLHDGTVALVSARGDVTFLDEGGEERAAIKGTAGQSGPAVATSDGTVVFATSGGDVVGASRSSNQPRFVVHVGAQGVVRAAPLSLDDGGVAVAVGSDVVILDSEGNVRTRATLAEPPAVPLVAAGDKIVAVSANGNIYGWTPGRDAARIGTFGGAVDGGAVLTESGVLLAVVGGNRIVEVDLAHGRRTTRAVETAGIYLGPPAHRTAASGSVATLLSLTPMRGLVVSVDALGQEVLRAPVATFTPSLLPDGGPAPLAAPPHVGPLVDAAGSIAFVATDGRVGVIGPDGTVDTLGESLCLRGSRSSSVGLTPAGPGAFLVACDSGTLVRITGQKGARSSPPPPSRPAVPSSSAVP